MLLPSALGFSPHPPVSVYGTGTLQTIAAFLGRSISSFDHAVSTLRSAFLRGICLPDGLSLVPASSFPALLISLRPHISVASQYRNINLLSIDYASRPRLRSRLPQSRSALLWNPWIFGLDDSHIHLATHSGILSSKHSTAPSGTASSRFHCSSTARLREPMASVSCFSPGHFRRRTSRLVSCYALFE